MSRYTYVVTIDAMWDRLIRSPVTVKAVSLAYASTMPADQNGKRADPAKALIAAGQKVDNLVYEPGGPAFLEANGVRSLNTWQPGSLRPEPGDPAPFLDHFAYLLDGDLAAQEFLLDWMAHLVQQPAIKMRTAVVIIGGQGIGKTMLGSMLIDMVGAYNASTVEASDLRSQFNEWADGTQLVVVNEMAAMDNAEVCARLKAYISDDAIRINRKGVTTYPYRNVMNFLMFANPGAKLRIEEGDRRYFIWRSGAIRRLDDYYQMLMGWWRAGGDRAVLHYLLHRDLARFNPNAPAPVTAAKEALITDSRAPGIALLQEMIEADTPPFQRDLVMMADVVHALAARGIHLNQVEAGAALRSLGAEELGQKRIGTRKIRLWATKNVSHWTKATESTIAHHWASGSNPMGLEDL